MGCCPLFLRQNRCEDYEIWHSSTIDRITGSSEMQIYERRKGRVQIIPVSMKISTDSGYSDFVDRLLQEDEIRLQRNYRFLLENLMPRCITPRLVEDGYLSPDDETAIRKGLTDRAGAELLIQKLVHSKPMSFEPFLNALRESNQEFIASKLEMDEKEQEEFPEHWTTRDMNRIKEMIVRKQSYILNELDPDRILGFFVEQELFQIDDIADMTFKSRREKAKILIACVLQKLPFAFNLLLHALRQTGSGKLADRFHTMVSDITDDNKQDGSLKSTNNGSHRYESKKSKAKILVKTTLCDGEDDQPLLGSCVVEQINTHGLGYDRCKLFKETECTFQGASDGSFILHMIPCSKRAYDKLLKFCKDGSFETLLETILMNENIKQMLPQGPLTVQVQLLAKGIIEESGRSDVATFRDKLIQKFDTVVEEIDPINFQRTFIDRQLLSAEYFDQLCRSLDQSRSARAADFVEKVLELGEEAVLAFMETIERKGPEYLLQVLKTDSTTVVDVPAYDEIIAKLEEKKPDCTASSEILFYEMDFRFAIQNTSSSSHGLRTDSPLHEIRVDVHRNVGNVFVKENPSRRSSLTSGYTSMQGSMRSNSTLVSSSTEFDQTKDLGGDLSL